MYKRIVDGREIVFRDGICDCGTVLYVKNVTDNKIDFLAKEKLKGLHHSVDERHQLIEPEGILTVLGVTCPDCGMRHKIAAIDGGTTIDDAIVVFEAGV